MTRRVALCGLILLIVAAVFCVQRFQTKNIPKQRDIRPIERAETLPSGEADSGNSVALSLIDTVESTVLKQPDARHTIGLILDGRKNAFFDDKKVVTEWFRDNPEAVKSVHEFLLDLRGIQTLSVSQSLIKERPLAVLERMVALDILSLAMHQNDNLHLAELASQALEDIVLDDVDQGLSTIAKKVLLGEKYDALKMLAGNDPRHAQDVLSNVSIPRLKNMLAEAMLAGFVDSGLTHDEAMRILKEKDF